MTPDEFRSAAASLDEEAVTLARSGQIVEAAKRAMEAERLREAAEALEALQPQTKHGKKRGMADTDTIALRMAQGRRSKSKLSEAALAAGFTLRSLGEAVGVSHAQLSSAHAGRFTIQESVAQHVEKLTGFAASKKNWPKGWAR